VDQELGLCLVIRNITHNITHFSFVFVFFSITIKSRIEFFTCRLRFFRMTDAAACWRSKIDLLAPAIISYAHWIVHHGDVLNRGMSGPLARTRRGNAARDGSGEGSLCPRGNEDGGEGQHARIARLMFTCIPRPCRIVAAGRPDVNSVPTDSQRG